MKLGFKNNDVQCPMNIINNGFMFPGFGADYVFIELL